MNHESSIACMDIHIFFFLHYAVTNIIDMIQIMAFLINNFARYEYILA